MRCPSDSMVGLPTGVPASHSDEGRSGYFPSSGLGSAGGHGVTIFGFVGIWSLSQLLSSALIACKQPQMTCKQSAAVFSTALFTKTKTNLACGKKSCRPCPRMFVLIFYGIFLPSLFNAFANPFPTPVINNKPKLPFLTLQSNSVLFSNLSIRRYVGPWKYSLPGLILSSHNIPVMSEVKTLRLSRAGSSQVGETTGSGGTRGDLEGTRCPRIPNSP